MNNNKKSSSKKNSEKASEAKKEVKTTFEDLQKVFTECNDNLKETAEKLGLKYVAAHYDDNGQPKQGQRARLFFEGRKIDKYDLLKSLGRLAPKATPKTGNNGNPEAIEAKAAEYEAKAAELRARAEEIRKARAEAEASKAKVNEAAKGLKADGLTVEERKQLLKVLKMQLANA